MKPKYEAIMASVWTGDLSQGTRCEVARCASPELAQRLAERLNRAEEESQLLNALLDHFSKAKADAYKAPTPSPNR